MQDLKEVTDTIHYENFRRKRLSEEQKKKVDLQNDLDNCQESKI